MAKYRILCLDGGGLRGLFSTHPSTEERVARLMALKHGAAVDFGPDAAPSVVADLLIAEHAGQDAGADLGPLPPAQRLQGALEGQADLAVDQVHRQALFPGQQHRALQFGARFDAQLFGQATLVGRQRKVGREQRHAALADHFHQVQLGQRVRLGQRLQALRIQFHRDRVEAAAVDGFFHRFHAGVRHVRGAQEGIAHAIAFDDAHRLAGEQRIVCSPVDGQGESVSHAFTRLLGRCRRRRPVHAASARCPASGHACGPGP